jgi:hypothetical protein
MRRSYSFLLLVPAILVFCAVSSAQNTIPELVPFEQFLGFDPYLGLNPSYFEFNAAGEGARAAGMGGAYLGIAEGEMAYSWNPAAMIYTDKTKIGIQLVSVMDSFQDAAGETQFFYGEQNVRSFERDREHFSLNFGGFAAPFVFMERDWAIGGGYRNVSDMVYEFDTPGFSGSKNTFTQDRGIDAVSFAIANKITEGIGIGLTINSYIRNSEFNYYWGAANPAIIGADTTAVDIWTNLNSHFSGFNLDVGLAGDFGMVKGGVVIHTPFDLRQDAKWTLQVIVPPQPQGLIDRVTYTHSIPIGYSVGLAAVPVENLTVAFDFDGRKMSDAEVKTNWEQLTFPDSTLNPGWEDINQFRVGAEYVLDGGFADIPVRAGFRNEPSVSREILYSVPGSPDSTEYGDQVTTNIFSFGTGLYFEKIWFDLAYQFGNSSYNRTINLGAAEAFEIKRDYSRLFLSAGMYF